jgi:hypothetical protein
MTLVEPRTCKRRVALSPSTWLEMHIKVSTVCRIGNILERVKYRRYKRWKLSRLRESLRVIDPVSGVAGHGAMSEVRKPRVCPCQLGQ